MSGSDRFAVFLIRGIAGHVAGYLVGAYAVMHIHESACF
jgi:hypothetical protein